MYLPRSYNPKPGILSENDFLLWASKLAIGMQEVRTNRHSPDFYHGWARGCLAIARTFRDLVS
jgi:hypothetical protein